MVQLTHTQVQQLFGRRCSELDVKYLIPSVDSNGICKFVIVIHTSSSVGFELGRYELTTGSVDILPPHPVMEPSNVEPTSPQSIREFFSVKNIKLSLRDFLTQRPKFTSTGSKL